MTRFLFVIATILMVIVMISGCSGNSALEERVADNEIRLNTCDARWDAQMEYDAQEPDRILAAIEERLGGDPPDPSSDPTTDPVVSASPSTSAPAVTPSASVPSATPTPRSATPPRSKSAPASPPSTSAPARPLATSARPVSPTPRSARPAPPKSKSAPTLPTTTPVAVTETEDMTEVEHQSRFLAKWREALKARVDCHERRLDDFERNYVTRTELEKRLAAFK